MPTPKSARLFWDLSMHQCEQDRYWEEQAIELNTTLHRVLRDMQRETDAERTRRHWLEFDQSFSEADDQ
jgi:hypothetical protein